ncbi:hypothetical protein B0H16DRAFT_1821984 [Mycena metata]|uniref:Uncharacterized protein n=1 Tax=Mycena metata TaxID=1033252 RepID=A0AAD7H0P7_9AGAR|nr:hypothetical protein B0H16DRAFT_1821984 [Mycena metata]
MYKPNVIERNSLAADRAHVAVIDAKIMELKRSLSLLNKERGRLQDQLDAYTYPVLTLPNEIVRRSSSTFSPYVGNGGKYTLSLTNGKHIDQKLRLLKLWLQRLGSRLLSIRMDLQIDDDIQLSGDTDPNLAATLDLFTRAIAAHSARWEYLRLYLPDVDPFPSIGPTLPFLRDLAMDSVNGTDSIREALHAAPLLQTVAIQLWHEHWISVYPWTQLTTFFGYGLLAHECVDILTQAINLVKCNVDLDWSDDDVSQPYFTRHNVPIPFDFNSPRLIPDDLPWKLLDIFTLPALQKLEIDEELLQGDPIGLLKSLISRSKCHMRELYVPDLDRRSLEKYRLALPAVGSIWKRGFL